MFLVDTREFLIVRVWKGYRETHCKFLSHSFGAGGFAVEAEYALLFLRKRNMLEVWRLANGVKVFGRKLRSKEAGTKMISLLKNNLIAGVDFPFFGVQRKTPRAGLEEEEKTHVGPAGN